MAPELDNIIASLLELKDENGSKQFKQKTEQIISILTGNQHLAVEKALMELEELNSYETPVHQRTLVWDIMSKLESIKH